MKLPNRTKKVTADFASSIASTFTSAAKSAVEKPKKAAAAKTKTQVEVQYPQEGEKVYKGHYAIRVDVDDSQNVQVSINNGDWQSCREACGHFWFDWYPAEAGSFRIVAKATLQDGRESKSVIRNCKVI